MTTISLLQAADVVALRCIYFQLVKSLKEISWYGLNCNTEDYINDVELAFVYLESITSGCPLTYSFECEIKTFIAKKSSYCIFSDNRCLPRYTVTNQGTVG